MQRGKTAAVGSISLLWGDCFLLAVITRYLCSFNLYRLGNYTRACILKLKCKSGNSLKHEMICLALLTACIANSCKAVENSMQCAVYPSFSFCWRMSIFIYYIISAAELPCPLGFTVLSFHFERKLVLMS